MDNNLNEIIEGKETFNVLHELGEFFTSVFELAESSYEAVINSAFFENTVSVIKRIDDSLEFRRYIRFDCEAWAEKTYIDLVMADETRRDGIDLHCIDAWMESVRSRRILGAWTSCI